jgi:regulatory protein
MRIEKIERSKHKQERLLVYLEGGDLLRLTGDALLRFGLQVGMDLSDEDVVQLKEAAQQYAVRSRGANIVSSRMVSKKELTDKLERRGATEEEAADTADWLEDLGALNDEAYAAAVARHYGRMGYGKMRVRQELQRRGVSRELWDDALAEMPSGAEAIESLLQSRLRGRTPDRDEGRKLSAMLQRRGFTWQEIRPVLQRFLDGEDLPEE